jgi:hypothetical protein
MSGIVEGDAGRRRGAIGRDRTPFLAVELCAVAVLIGSWLLPWFVRTSPDGAFEEPLTVGNAVDGGFILLVPPLMAVAAVFVGLVLPARGKWAAPIAFGLACVLPIALLFNPGAIDYRGIDQVRSALGLWAQAGAATAGLAAAIADLALGGATTRVSRVVGVPEMRVYVLTSAVALVATGLWLAQSTDVRGLLIAVVVLTAVPLAGPTWQARGLATVLSVGLVPAWMFANGAQYSVLPLLVFAAGAGLFVVHGVLTRPTPVRPGG